MLYSGVPSGVFCDSDPIGFYLNLKHIYYHSVEDGLDTLKNNDLANIDLSKLKGIGAKTFEKIKDKISFKKTNISENDVSIGASPAIAKLPIPRNTTIYKGLFAIFYKIVYLCHK